MKDKTHRRWALVALLGVIWLSCGIAGLGGIDAMEEASTLSFIIGFLYVLTS